MTDICPLPAPYDANLSVGMNGFFKFPRPYDFLTPRSDDFSLFIALTAIK